MVLLNLVEKLKLRTKLSTISHSAFNLKPYKLIEGLLFFPFEVKSNPPPIFNLNRSIA